MARRNGDLANLTQATYLGGAATDIGYAVAIYPAIGFLSAAKALETAYADLRTHGQTTDEATMYSFAEFNKLIGFEDVWEFERRYAETP